MSNHLILSHAPSINQIKEGKPRSGILNISHAHGRYSIELASLGRYDYLRRSSGRVFVQPEAGRALVATAKREGRIERVHRWGAITTWHLGEG